MSSPSASTPTWPRSSHRRRSASQEATSGPPRPSQERSASPPSRIFRDGNRPLALIHHVALAHLAEPLLRTPTFRALFEAELPYVRHTLRRLGVRERDVEDLTHDVFVAVHRGLPGYDPE